MCNALLSGLSFGLSGFSLGPLVAQGNECNQGSAAAANDVQQVFQAQVDAFTTVASAMADLAATQTAMVESGTQIHYLINQATLADQRQQLEVAIILPQA